MTKYSIHNSYGKTKMVYKKATVYYQGQIFREDFSENERIVKSHFVRFSYLRIRKKVLMGERTSDINSEKQSRLCQRWSGWYNQFNPEEYSHREVQGYSLLSVSSAVSYFRTKVLQTARRSKRCIHCKIATNPEQLRAAYSN